MQLQRQMIHQIATKTGKSFFFLLLLLISIKAVADSSLVLIPAKQSLSFKTNTSCTNADLQISGISPKVEKLQWKHNNQLLKTSYIPSLIQTMRHFRKDFTKLKVAIVGDIVHSRVAKSNIHALTALGCTDIRAIGPESLILAQDER